MSRLGNVIPQPSSSQSRFIEYREFVNELGRPLSMSKKSSWSEGLFLNAGNPRLAKPVCHAVQTPDPGRYMRVDHDDRSAMIESRQINSSIAQ